MQSDATTTSVTSMSAPHAAPTPILNADSESSLSLPPSSASRDVIVLNAVSESSLEIIAFVDDVLCMTGDATSS